MCRYFSCQKYALFFIILLNYLRESERVPKTTEFFVRTICLITHLHSALPTPKPTPTTNDCTKRSLSPSIDDENIFLKRLFDYFFQYSHARTTDIMMMTAVMMMTAERVTAERVESQRS